MADMVNYTCSKCGGVLNVAPGHMLFDCPFCGADFNYYDFYRKEMIEQAESCMYRYDFDMAKRRFEEVLAYDPQDFAALRGLVLCEGNIIALKNLSSPSKLEGCKFHQMSRIIGDVLSRAREEDKEYFRKLLDLFSVAKQYIQLKNERNTLSDDSNKQFKQIARVDDNHKQTVDNLTKVLLIIGMIITAPFAGEDTTKEDRENAAMFAIGVIGVGIILAVFFKFGLWAFAISLVVVAGIIGLLAFVKHLENKKKAPHRKALKDNKSRISDCSSRMFELENKYKSEYEELQKLAPDVKKTTLSKELLIKKTSEDIFSGEAQTLICNKCGGFLELDRQRRLYECRSCGVAYSTSLMSETDGAQKAVELLKKKDFSDADNRFILELMLDPHNFTALNGRILCAGRWKDIHSISETGFHPIAKVDDIRARLTDAIEHCRDEDKDYFLKFKDLIEIIEESSANLKLIDKYSKGDFIDRKNVGPLQDANAELKVEFEAVRKDLNLYNIRRKVAVAGSGKADSN